MALTDDPVRSALLIAARHGLAPNDHAVRLDDDEAAAVLAVARTDKLTGLLGSAVADGKILMSEEATGRAEQQWQRHLLASVGLEAFAVRTSALLASAGVEHRLTKGAALAHLDYTTPSQRVFGDVDVVVHPDQWELALTELHRAGHRRRTAALPMDYDNRYGKGATLLATSELELDLHRRFAIGCFGITSRMEDVFVDHNEIELAGVAIPTLSKPNRLLHACYHATLGGFRELRAFRDVAQLIVVSEVDWRSTTDTSRRWRGEAVVASAVRETWVRLQLDAQHPCHVWARDVHISPRERRALRHFTEHPTFRGQALTSLWRLPPSEIPRYLWSLAGPRSRRRDSE